MINIKEVTVKLLEVEVQLGVEENEFSVEIIDESLIFFNRMIPGLVFSKVFMFLLINIKEVTVKLSISPPFDW